MMAKLPPAVTREEIERLCTRVHDGTQGSRRACKDFQPGSRQARGQRRSRSTTSTDVKPNHEVIGARRPGSFWRDDEDRRRSNASDAAHPRCAKAMAEAFGFTERSSERGRGCRT